MPCAQSVDALRLFRARDPPGVFSVDARDANARFSPEVDALQRRFTFLMKNGDRIPLSEGTCWPTRLVRVP